MACLDESVNAMCAKVRKPLRSNYMAKLTLARGRNVIAKPAINLRQAPRAGRAPAKIQSALRQRQLLVLRRCRRLRLNLPACCYCGQHPLKGLSENGVGLPK